MDHNGFSLCMEIINDVIKITSDHPCIECQFYFQNPLYVSNEEFIKIIFFITLKKEMLVFNE